MSLRALHLLVAVHALAAHLGQSPRCVTSADISDFQEPSSSTGRRELTILLWKLTTGEFRIEVRGSVCVQFSGKLTIANRSRHN